jgi:hypothetical protein
MKNESENEFSVCPPEFCAARVARQYADFEK